MGESDTKVSVDEVFNFFDVEGNNSIPAERLGEALRSLGRRLTEENVKSLTDKAKEGGGTISLEQFKEFLNESADVQKTTEDIESAFKVFEKESEMKSHGAPGSVDKRVLKHALISLGDNLSTAEVEQFLSMCGQGPSMDLDTFMNVVNQNA